MYFFDDDDDDDDHDDHEDGEEARRQPCSFMVSRINPLLGVLFLSASFFPIWNTHQHKQWPMVKEDDRQKIGTRRDDYDVDDHDDDDNGDDNSGAQLPRFCLLLGEKKNLCQIT